MSKMKTLIDKAVEICGSVEELARQLDVKPQVISMLRHGRTITPETAAELADVVGDDPREAAIVAIIERAKGTRREDAMQEILGKPYAAGEVAQTSLSTTESDTTKEEPTEGTDRPALDARRVMFRASPSPFGAPTLRLLFGNALTETVPTHERNSGVWWEPKKPIH